MLGASVRLFVVSAVLQILVFEPLGIPFWLNAVLTTAMVYLITFRGGVKSVVWTDLLKTCCLILSVALCIFFIMRSGVSLEGMTKSEMGRTFFFDNPKEPTFFWKQFLAGIFLVIATTGLDQDMMQRTLSCKNFRESQKNMITGAVLQIFVIGLFLVLGYMLYTYAATSGIDISALKGDEVFPYLATGNFFPMIVGILFIVGFIAAAYSAAGSALTALTTSFSVDILGIQKHDEQKQRTIRTWVHVCMTVIMASLLCVIYILNDDAIIQTVYKVASYTYGPLLGMFCFGMFTKYDIRDKWIPLVVIAAPVITWIIDVNSAAWFGGYTFSHERLLLNALLTFIGMLCLVRGKQPA